MSEIRLQKSDTVDGWRFRVAIRDPDGSTSEHEVELTQEDYHRLTEGKVTPERLVEESFRFLLEREPKESILRRFALPAIGRYFPEYEREIKRRLGG